MLRVIALSVLIVAISAEGCRPPMQWQGVVGTNTGFSQNGQGYLAQGQLRLAVDSSLRKVALSGGSTIKGKYSSQKQLQDYSQGIMYEVTDGTCKKSRLPPTNPFVDPTTAKQVVDGYYGLLGRSTLNFTTYETPYPGPFFQGTQYITMTPDCVPIGQVIFGAGSMTISGYYNIRPGVPNPNVFDVPKECKEVTDAPIEDLKVYEEQPYEMF